VTMRSSWLSSIGPHSKVSRQICTVNLLTAVTLGGAYNGGRFSPVGVRDLLICCSGQ